MKKILAPHCPKRSRNFNEFGQTRIDPFFWLREIESPDVRKYVDEENEYFYQVMKPLEKIENQFFDELRDLIEPIAIEVPYRIGK